MRIMIYLIRRLLSSSPNRSRKWERVEAVKCRRCRRQANREGEFLTWRALLSRVILSWSARTRVMSPCLFDPLSRILMMVQMSRRTGAILSREFRPDAGPPTLSQGDEPPFLAATQTTSFLYLLDSMEFRSLSRQNGFRSRGAAEPERNAKNFGTNGLRYATMPLPWQFHVSCQ